MDASEPLTLRPPPCGPYCAAGAPEAHARARAGVTPDWMSSILGRLDMVLHWSPDTRK